MSGTPIPGEREDAHDEQGTPRVIRYTIARTVIDGREFAHGTEVAFRLLGQIVLDRIVSEDGLLVPIKRFVIRDWAGPFPERYNPPRDPIDAALAVLVEYVTLPLADRDAGSPERVRADPPNREMMRRIIAAYDNAVERSHGGAGA